MAIPILKFWEKYYTDPDEGLGSTYERFIINRVLFKVKKHFNIKSVLEAPSFGFTGMSGINSMALAKDDCSVTLLDHDQKRIEYISKTWTDLGLALNIHFTEDYSTLHFNDKSFDMSWNFSALWFVDSLSQFLSELDRVSKKIILLMVPNQSGIGYLQQKYSGQDDLKKYLNEDCIKVKNIKKEMRLLGWSLLNHQYIDCPLWPDIGMSKEDFLKKMNMDFLLPQKKVETKKSALTILDYYADISPKMDIEMQKYEFFEKHSPEAFKKLWSHHQYLLFIKNEK